MGLLIITRVLFAGLDLVVPGVATLSALKGSTCGVTDYSGTSMSTPAVSGSLALLRQYLVQNQYEKLNALKMLALDDTKTLSGSLLKALMIHSAEPMTGKIDVNNALQTLPQSYPNNYVGYGRANLNNIIDHPQLMVVNRLSLDPGYGYAITFNVSSKSNMKVTVAWYDWAGIYLINDIDLKLVFNGRTFYGNGNTTGYDDVNTVESVQLPIDPQYGTVTLVVTAKSKNVGNQTISMAITGDVKLWTYVRVASDVPSSLPVGTIVGIVFGLILGLVLMAVIGIIVGLLIWRGMGRGAGSTEMKTQFLGENDVRMGSGVYYESGMVDQKF